MFLLGSNAIEDDFMPALTNLGQPFVIVRRMLVLCQIVAILLMTACGQSGSTNDEDGGKKVASQEGVSSRVVGVQVYSKGKKTDYFQYEYDNQHRLTDITGKDQSSLARYQYNNKGNLSRKDQSVQTLQGTQSVSVFYGYDNNGMLNERSISSDSLQSSSKIIRDPDNHRIINVIEQPLSGITQDEQVTKIEYQSENVQAAIKKDVRLDYRFNDGLLESIRVSDNLENRELSRYEFQYQGQKIQQMSQADRKVIYEYGLKGNLARVVEFQNEKIQNSALYSYDAMGRLLKVQLDSDGDSQLDRTYVLQYDQAPCKPMDDPDKSLTLFDVPKFPHPLDIINVCFNTSVHQ